MLSEEQQPLRIYFFPLMSPGHMIPMIDMAKLFARRREVSATIITTPGNAPLVRPSIASSPINLILLPFPPSVTHLLPNGIENLTSFTSSHFPSFFTAFYALQQPIDDLLHSHRPDCIVSDAMFTWTADTAIALNIPRIVLYGHGIFPSCVHDSLELHGSHTKVSDDSESFVVEGLPHRIEMTRSEISAAVFYLYPQLRESVAKSHSIVVNSFYELEPEYAELYRKSRRAFYVGPVSLSNKNSDEMADRGQKANDEVIQRTKTWLNSREINGSVVYVCFGSLNEFSADQLREIELGLEESGRPFICVVKSFKGETEFEERAKGKGLVIRGWAPQVVILNHPAVGGFVTHCGWNSTLESISAGVPMATCPVEYEQYVNEKLITEVLKVGVSVGRGETVEGGKRVVKAKEIAEASERLMGRGEAAEEMLKVGVSVGRGEAVESGKRVVKAKEIAEAVERLMGDGEEAEERRARVRKYAELAAAAVEEGGSSDLDLTRLIDEIRGYTTGPPNVIELSVLSCEK